ncbi:MAG: ribosome maturation factor RimP [bacterium]|nr:MAG: ribosome maturation factor RimP [bacterium]
MDTRRIIGRLREILAPIMEQLDLELVDVTLRTEGGRWILRVTIDCEGGVTVDHCTAVSRELGVHLDVEDLIPMKYYLEVSSPGLDRPLKEEADFIRFKGRLVLIKTHRSVAGRRKISGTLDGLADGVVSVTLEDGTRLEVPVEDISSARLDYRF